MHAPILVPVDFSDCAHNALTLAAELARSQDRPLVILHVSHDRVLADGQRCHIDPQHPSLPLIDIARRRLSAFVEEQVKREPVLAKLDDLRALVVDGIPAHRIVEVAQREGADLIVMGSHGRSGFARLMMGSVAEAVTRKSPVPVTVVKNGMNGYAAESAA